MRFNGPLFIATGLVLVLIGWGIATISALVADMDREPVAEVAASISSCEYVGEGLECRR